MPYVDRIVIAVPQNAQARVRQLIERLGVLPNEVMLFVDQGAGRPRRRARRGSPKRRWRRSPARRATSGGRWSSAARTWWSGSLAVLVGAAADGADRARHQARQPRPGVLPPAPPRLQQRRDPGLEVPLDAARLRDRAGGAQQVALRRRPRHPRRPHHPPHQPRRAAAAHQRAEGRDVAGRAAPARSRHEDRRHRERQAGRRIRPPPSHEARHDRLGGHQGLARAGGHARAGQAPRGARHRIHRTSVAHARSYDHGA